MALNRFMHPRNIYKDSPPRFKELAEQYPDLKAFLVERPGEPAATSHKSIVSLDFENPAALRSLTCALLRRDFNLDIDLPLTKLIPTVPSRLNYLLWIEDLLHAHKIDLPLPGGVLGLDIGSGASCIYALLGWRKNGWSFVTTEADEEALRFAQQNVVKNGAAEKITVLPAYGSSHLLETVKSTGREFQFCMCNPPFFGSLAERDEKASYKPPKHACNPVAETDAVVEGGEVAFVSQMIGESVQLSDKIKIYSSMLGKKSSVAPLKAILDAQKIPYTTTEFCQGRTMRWGLAWSHCLDMKSVTVVNPHKAPDRPLTYEIDFGSKSETDRMRVCLKVMELLEKNLKMYLVSERGGKERSQWRVSALKNLWSNQRRKRREEKNLKAAEEDVEMGDGESVVESSLSRSSSRTPDSTDEAKINAKYLIQFHLTIKSDSMKYAMELRWIDGENREYLHSIVVYLKNQLQEFLQR
ncbi:Methyltransferase-like protein 16 [Hypsibius exemplaris]|uniref:U6 small nuclear RNA (adenine-(43)-N(6))-methyltransferase n=1 Tax=Hypsibius exemplaris TaxID=2072580 RepID=A0A9X6RLG6_HYPEX|nr:Methyltransferase-like protein 16 [Hypsibius exemplaris]